MHDRALFPLVGFKGKQTQFAGRNAPAAASAARRINLGDLGCHGSLVGSGFIVNDCWLESHRLPRHFEKMVFVCNRMTDVFKVMRAAPLYRRVKSEIQIAVH